MTDETADGAAPQDAAPSTRRGNRRRATRRKRQLAVALLCVGAVLAAAAVWVGIRALLARDALDEAMPLAERAVAEVTAGDVDAATVTVDALAERTTRARDLTSDPVWRAAEVLPWLGANLQAVREASAVVADVTTSAVPPLVDVAGSVDPDALAPVDGAIALQPLVDAQPKLAEAASVLGDAVTRSNAIETEGTIGQVRTAVDQLTTKLTEFDGLVTGLESATALLPPMLGADGPREYLLLSLNNAEVRATGGIPGAVVHLRVEAGRPQLVETFSTGDFGTFDPPVAPVSEGEELLYSTRLTRYLQDVTFTPDFARSGELAAEMWRQRTGGTIDGVLAVDPVLLSYLLEATGPVQSAAGVQLDADNAVRVLLSDAYAMFEEPAHQDAFFAEVAGRVFERLVAGGVSPRALLDGLARGADEDRLHVWSAHEQEQSRLADAGLTSALPVTDASTTGIGVYLNDGTGAKMDYYLGGSISTRSIDCRQDGRPYFQVGVRLTSEAPADAASVLPPYVTGGGVFGVEPGDISTGLFVYVPEGSDVYSVQVDGVEEAFVLTQDAGHTVAAVSTLLSPGEQVDVTVSFVAPEGAPVEPVVAHSPLALPFPVADRTAMPCPEPDNGDQVDARGELVLARPHRML